MATEFNYFLATENTEDTEIFCFSHRVHRGHRERYFQKGDEQ